VPRRPSRGQRGFSLIEILAVVIIIGLTLSLVLPNMAATRASRLKQHALDIAARLELARERAIVTGIPHRLFIDLGEGSYRVEWFVTSDEAYASLDELDAPPEEPPADPNMLEVDAYGNLLVSLSPPIGEQANYFAVPNRFGNADRLPDEIYFVGIDTWEGWIERGGVQIVFERDGTTDFTEIHLADAWDHLVVIEIQPLLDTVRVHTGE
jgi:prepilin-type N-terminal cleavage/methylation domain-containing protein